MKKEIKLKIGDIKIRFHYEKTKIMNLDHPFYKKFIVENKGSVDVDLRIHCNEFPGYSPGKMVFDATGNHWRLYNYKHKLLIEIFSASHPYAKEKVGLVERDFSFGEVWVKSTYLSLPRLMQPLGEIFLINHLSKGKGILAHAAGIEDEGEGIVFFGASEAGKSTLANLYQNHSKNTVIHNDERIIIRKEKDKFWLYGTPWSGRGFTDFNNRVQIKKVFFIEHGSQNKIISEPVTSRINRMFQQLFLPFWNKEGINFALNFCKELTSSIPSRKLAFVNDEKVIDFIRQA